MCMHVYMFMSTACALCEWTMQMDQRIRVRAVLAAGGGELRIFSLTLDSCLIPIHRQT